MILAVINADSVTYYKSVRHACKALDVQSTYITDKLDSHKLCNANQWSKLLQILSSREIYKSFYHGWE